MMFIGHDSDRYGYLSQHGKPIPSGSIAQRCGCTLPLYLTLLQELDDFGVPSRTPDGTIYSRRMVRDHEKRELAAERQRKHRKTNKVSHALVTRLSRACHRDNEDEIDILVSSSESKKLRKSYISAESPDFVEFWRLYPKRVGKADAEKAWSTHCKNGELGEIRKALAWQVKSEQWQQDNGKFIPHPATYLRRKQWTDEPLQPTENTKRKLVL